MILRLLPLSVLLLTGPAYAQFVYLQDIDVDLENPGGKVAITVTGVKPSPCFIMSSSPLREDAMVTIHLEARFPSGVTRCFRENAPFEVTEVIETPPAGEYEAQVTINGEMQVQYRNFTIAAAGEPGIGTVAGKTAAIAAEDEI